MFGVCILFWYCASSDSSDLRHTQAKHVVSMLHTLFTTELTTGGDTKAKHV